MAESTEARRRLGKRLGLRVSERRKVLNWTQDQLAAMLEVDAETISRFERGATVPSLVTLDRLARILKVSVADLLSDVSASPSDQAIRVSAWLESLPAEDSDFVLDQVKTLCDHLRSRGFGWWFAWAFYGIDTLGKSS